MIIRNVDISFTAYGHINQIVELKKDVSNKELQDGLNSGKYVTTIQENGKLVISENNEEIAIIMNVDNELTYEDFEVTDA